MPTTIEAINDPRGWTSSHQQAILPTCPLILHSGTLSESGHPVLRIGSEEVPPVIREAQEIVDKVLAKDFDEKFDIWTQSEAPRLVWAPTGVFTYVGLGLPITSPDAESRHFTVQSTPISADPTPRMIRRIKEWTNLPREVIGKFVGVSRQAVNNWERKQPIASEHRRKLLAVSDILDRARQRFQTQDQLSQWLYAPCTEDGKSPFDLILEGNYDRARYYAVARPVAGVRPLPAWASKSVPGKSSGMMRSRREGTPAELDNLEGNEWSSGPSQTIW